MTDLVEQLHDEIDEEENLQARAREVVTAKAADLADLLNELGDVEEALTAFATLVEDELTDVTTDAVKLGKDSYLARADTE